MSLNSFREHALFRSLPFLIGLGGAAKLLVDTTVQLYNPFLIVIATGAGIGTVAMGRIVALRNLTGLVAPLLGTLADRIGHRTVMRASLFTIGAAMILAPATGSLFVFGLAVVLTGVGHSGYTPNLHAYLSGKLPYEKRAMGIGIVEYSWALAGIVGLFFSGYLIEAYSWKAPFYAFGSALILMSILFTFLPRVERRPGRPRYAADPRRRLGLMTRARRFLVLGPHASSTWAAIAVTGLNMFAMMHLLIIHGGWLGEEYGLSPSGLGTVALLLGGADLLASVTVSLFVDRIGKRRSVIMGVMGMVAGYAVLPILNRSLVLAVLSIAIPRVSFEFAVVSNFPLLSEQVPQSRGKVMSLGMTAGLLGATVAGLTGPAAYLRFGVWGLGPVSCVAAIFSLLLLIIFVREQPHRSDASPIAS